MKQYFTYRDTSEPLKVIICPADYDNFPYKTRTSSYGVAEARVCGLPYHEYIKFLMYSFPEDVQVVGKNSMYPTIYWRKGAALYNFVRFLNSKMELLLTEERMILKEEQLKKKEAIDNEDKE